MDDEMQREAQCETGDPEKGSQFTGSWDIGGSNRHQAGRCTVP
jgi:hypothetical protein